MTWCPRCRMEHAEEMKFCPDCDGKLLEEVPTDDELVTDIEWVTVAANTGKVLGHLIKARLEEAQIPVIIKGGQFDTVKTYEGFDTKIRVPKRFFDEAKVIAQDMMESPDEELACDSCGATVTEEDIVCPKCGERFGDDPDA